MEFRYIGKDKTEERDNRTQAVFILWLRNDDILNYVWGSVEMNKYENCLNVQRVVLIELII